MKTKPLLLLILMIAVPILILVAVGFKLAHNEQQMFAQRIRELLTVRLGDIDQSVAGYFQSLERDLYKLTSLDDYDSERLRELIRSEPGISQLFVINPNDKLIHPNPAMALNRTEQEFFNQTAQVIIDRDIQRAAESQADVSATSNTATNPAFHSQQPKISGPLSSGWFTWYWGRGVNLIYWQQRPSGDYVGVTLERSRWMADLISALPDTPSASNIDVPLSRIRLIDSKTQPVYQWGNYEPADKESPACSISLSLPVNSWRLEQYVPPERLNSGTLMGTYFNLGAGLLVATLGLCAIGLFFYRDYARDMREAGQRVSFVNQVSHELRTPLTNIRMYGDLLENDLNALPEEQIESPRNRLRIILSESQRLSRLIDNVLTFARQQKNTLQLKQQPCIIDQLVEQILNRSRPSLQKHEIIIKSDLNAKTEVLVDADKVEQILCNLITNVEKYAALGRWIGINTHQSADETVIQVCDHGPGIEASLRVQVFQPFWRGSEELNDTAGTGIGLTIARELARLHGGDITILPSENGTCFEVTLKTSQV